MRVFNKPLGREIGSWFGVTQQVCLNTNVVMTGINDELTLIKTQLDTIIQRLQSEPEQQTEDALFQTNTPTKVALYYFNETEDQKLVPEQQVNINSILLVYRIFPASKNLLLDAIRELIKWNLTASEKQQGFLTEFPNPRFTLDSVELIPNWTLTLQFTEVPGFTDGGSARMLILSNSIIKTAMQFPGVKKVVFSPESLFQP